MKNKNFRRILVFGFLALFLMASFIPVISSYQSNFENKENTVSKDEFSCEVTRPSLSLYINDNKIWDFRYLVRGIVIGEITLKATAVDDVNGIDYVEFNVLGGWNNPKFTVYEEPYEVLWDDWGPGIYHIWATAYNTLGESVQSTNDVQIFKLG